MIIEGLIRLLGSVARLFISSLDALTGAIPGFVDATAAGVGIIRAATASTDAWVNWGLLVTAAAAVTAAKLSGVAIKMARIVAAFFTGGGGAA